MDWFTATANLLSKLIDVAPTVIKEIHKVKLKNMLKDRSEELGKPFPWQVASGYKGPFRDQNRIDRIERDLYIMQSDVIREMNDHRKG